jgi:hypothetical protein
MSVKVLPLNRHAIWFFAHVRKKIQKRFQPTIANLYAASAVSVVAVRGGVSASVYHVPPALVSLGLFTAPIVAVLDCCVHCRILEVPTRRYATTAA